jgi:hypothetical protein
LQQQLDAKRACRIAYEMTTGGYEVDKDNWLATQTAIIDAMIHLEKALSLFD